MGRGRTGQRRLALRRAAPAALPGAVPAKSRPPPGRASPGPCAPRMRWAACQPLGGRVAAGGGGRAHTYVRCRAGAPPNAACGQAQRHPGGLFTWPERASRRWLYDQASLDSPLKPLLLQSTLHLPVLKACMHVLHTTFSVALRARTRPHVSLAHANPAATAGFQSPQKCSTATHEPQAN